MEQRPAARPRRGGPRETGVRRRTLVAAAAAIACLLAGAAITGLYVTPVAAAAPGTPAHAVVLTNVRIVTGTGTVIERGTIIVADGRIASVTAGPAPASARGTRIDAQGMTAIAGYIDCHRHLIPAGRPGAATSPDDYLRRGAAAEMRALLESGVTTVQSGGDDGKAVVALRAMVDSGTIAGPRILAGAWAYSPVMAPRTMTDVQTRAAIDAVKREGADSVGEIPYPTIASMTIDTQWPFKPTEQETRNLSAALDEGNRIGIPVQIHAVSPDAQVAAVRLGARRLVHSPHYAFMTDDQAREIAAAGAMVASSTGVGAPVFGVFNASNVPTTRDGAPWPAGSPSAEERGQSAGKFPVNLRTLYDNGVTVAYSSDTSFEPTAGLAHELNMLSLVFSPLDLVRIMGANSAAFVDRLQDRGTLERGKLGDILLLSGDPLKGYWNLLRPVVVIKGGDVVVDKRRQLRVVKTLRPCGRHEDGHRLAGCSALLLSVGTPERPA